MVRLLLIKTRVRILGRIPLEGQPEVRSELLVQDSGGLGVQEVSELISRLTIYLRHSVVNKRGEDEQAEPLPFIQSRKKYLLETTSKSRQIYHLQRRPKVLTKQSLLHH